MKMCVVCVCDSCVTRIINSQHNNNHKKKGSKLTFRNIFLCQPKKNWIRYQMRNPNPFCNNKGYSASLKEITLISQRIRTPFYSFSHSHLPFPLTQMRHIKNLWHKIWYLVLPLNFHHVLSLPRVSITTPSPCIRNIQKRSNNWKRI